MTTLRRWRAADAARLLPRPTRASDKYSRGVVGVRTGSERYPGAAVLGVEAAWRAGAGMVRWLGPASVRAAVLARRPETVVADGRVQCWVIGSGTDPLDRDAGERDALSALLAGEVPVVVDAGALDLAAGASAPRVLTPHAGELDRLGFAGGGADRPRRQRVRAAVRAARELGAAVLLKGAETLVADGTGRVRVVEAPTPWLSTAGTGDVLAGAIGALVAADGAPRSTGRLADLAATAALLHGEAGRRAAGRGGRHGGPLVALEVAEELAPAVGDLLGRRRR